MQTLANLESVVRAQKWAASSYPGQDVTQLITNVQSWVIVFIGLGEGTGILLGSLLYEQIGFRWECDIVSCIIIVGAIFLIVLDKDYKAPDVSIDDDSNGTK